MTSSRRVKKGPGRRPQSANRQRFMELRARGWSGYETYRNGVVVGFVPPLDRLEVREISLRYLSQDERSGRTRRLPDVHEGSPD